MLKSKGTGHQGREAASVPNGAVARSGGPDLVEGVVRELSLLVREATVDLALKVGALVIERFYAGDADGWRVNDRRPSLRRLASHPELPLSASALQRCVGLYVLTGRVGDLKRFAHLGSSHFRAVFGLPVAEQKRLLEEANAQRWTVLRLETKTAAERESSGSRPGRPRTPVLVKNLRQLRSLTASSVAVWPGEDELTEAQKGEVRRLAREARMVLEHLNAEIDRWAPPSTSSPGG